jgi:predicted CxxxxCH...CXXCH cytochrome family protein
MAGSGNCRELKRNTMMTDKTYRNNCSKKELSVSLINISTKSIKEKKMGKTSKTLRSRTCMKLTFILAFLVIAIAGMGITDSAEAQFTVTACTDCHGQPPADGSARNTPAGAVIGSHVKHATDQGIACTVCHGDTTSGGTDFAHRDGNIQTASPIHSGTGAYSKGTSFAQSNSPTMGTCSNIYCHSNVQSTNGTAAADTFASPEWGSGAVACDSCHGQDADETDGMPDSGSHNVHAGSQVGEMNYACTVCHNNGGFGNANHADDTLNMDIDNAYGASAAYSQGDHAPGSGGYGSCSSINCHGSGSETWGTDLSNIVTCTKCHGEQVASPGVPTEAQKAPGGLGVDTNGDSAATDAQVGAHQLHISLSSGYTNQLNSGGSCNECHTVPSAVGDAGHIDTALPAEVFGNSPEKADLNSVTPSYSAGSCTVYCHGASMPSGSSEGSDTSPAWNNTLLLTGTPSLAGDCGVCHGAPPTTLPVHTGSETINDCDTCHTHFNNDGTLADASLHINGTLEVVADCNICHAYPPTPGDGKNYRAVEGKGAHATHVTNIAAALSVTLNASSDAFLNNAVCGVCHDVSTDNNHMNASRNILISTAYQFGASAPAYNGVVGTVGATTAKTCSNVSCHFQTTPQWESY